MFKDFKNTPEEWVKVFKTQQEWLSELRSDPTEQISRAETFMAVIDFTTCDIGFDEELAPRFVKVLKSITERTTFEFIEESHQNYLDFLIVVNLPRFHKHVNWGTSIRGAWFEISHKKGAFDYYNELPATSSSVDCHLICDTTEKYLAFIRGLIMFMEEPQEVAKES